MRRIIIFGNSGSGKSTLAKTLCRSFNLAHLDLDTLAWLPTDPPQRKPDRESQSEIEAFMAKNSGWVIEGCYGDLIDIVIPGSNELIFLDLPIEDCVSNTRNRPWEPHKYASSEQQDANLEMLIEWIRQYEARTDTFSKTEHERLFDSYSGTKSRLTSNAHTGSVI